jgi:hypothetical protein
MNATRRRLVGVAAALSTVALAVPLATASAASAAPALGPAPYAGAWWGSGFGLPFTGITPGVGVTVTGPIIITTAPSTFINTNNQVSAASNFAGGQVT